MAEGAGVWIKQRGGSWQLRFREYRGGTFSYETFASLALAERRAEACRALLAATRTTTIDEALDDYAKHQQRAGLRPRSVEVTKQRLRLFFAGHADDLADTVTPKLCTAMYRALADATKKDGSPQYAVDTHRNCLTYAKTFGAWLVERKLWRANHAAGVQAQGQRSRGKAQLRFDEARSWYAEAMRLAPTDATAVGALCALLLGLRASEIISRTVRDLDDGGKLMWIEESRGGRFRPKSRAGRRAVEVPDPLRPLLLALAKGRGREEALWPSANRYSVRRWVAAVCRAAKVPVITAHGMRGQAATLATEAGTAGHIVAATLGHESFATTAAHYAQPGSTEKAQQRAALSVLRGGKKR